MNLVPTEQATLHLSNSIIGMSVGTIVTEMSRVDGGSVSVSSARAIRWVSEHWLASSKWRCRCASAKPLATTLWKKTEKGDFGKFLGKYVFNGHYSAQFRLRADPAELISRVINWTTIQCFSYHVIWSASATVSWICKSYSAYVKAVCHIPFLRNVQLLQPYVYALMQ